MNIVLGNLALLRSQARCRLNAVAGKVVEFVFPVLLNPKLLGESVLSLCGYISFGFWEVFLSS
jgi:hypothetical protein